MEGSRSSRVSEPSDGKRAKEPCQTKEEHDTCNTDEQSDGLFLVHLFFGTTKCVLGVLDEDPDHHDKDDNIEEQDDKDGAQESSKEYCSVRDEAAGEREHNHSMLNQLSLSGMHVLCT